MRIFMTGATGVIGRRVVPLCLQRGHEVTALARSADRTGAIERLGARSTIADMFDRDGLARAMAGHDVVINLATHIPKSTMRMLLPGAWRENNRIRSEGSANIAAAALAAGVKRMIQESFGLLYPDRGDAWIDETVPIDPAPYNRAVEDAERSAARFTQGGGIGVALRFASFYGPDSRFLRDMVGMIYRGYSPLPAPLEAYLPTVHHDDAATAALAALELPAGVYNVVDDQPLTHRELVDSLADALGAHHPRFLPMWLTKLIGGPLRTYSRSMRLSNRKLVIASGWSPKFRSVHDGWPTAVAPFRRAPREEVRHIPG
jgi:nucleoside-diphosphate-sugar epimerase